MDITIDSIEKELIKLKKEGAIDYDRICSRDQYLEVIKRLDAAEYSNTNQDK